MRVQSAVAALAGLVLAGMLASCGRSARDAQQGAGASSPQAAQVVPADTLPPMVEDPSGALALPSLADYLSGAASYRLETALQFVGQTASGQPASWRGWSHYASVASPPSWAVTLAVEDTARRSELNSLSAYLVGEESYMLIPPLGCLGGSAESVSGVLDNPILPWRFMPGITSATPLDDEQVVGGLAVRSYRFDETDLPGWSERSVSVEGRLLVSNDDGRLVQVTMEITGQADYLATGTPADGTLTVRLDLSDINGPVSVEPPPECISAETYPMMDGAYQVTSIEDLLTYRVRSTLEEAVAFYQRRMPETGWVAASEVTLVDESAALGYVRDGRSVTVSIEYSVEEQAIMVLISP
jgi:hypothetical protein